MGDNVRVAVALPGNAGGLNLGANTLNGALQNSFGGDEAEILFLCLEAEGALFAVPLI